MINTTLRFWRSWTDSCKKHRRMVREKIRQKADAADGWLPVEAPVNNETAASLTVTATAPDFGTPAWLIMCLFSRMRSESPVERSGLG